MSVFPIGLNGLKAIDGMTYKTVKVGNLYSQQLKLYKKAERIVVLSALFDKNHNTKIHLIQIKNVLL